MGYDYIKGKLAYVHCEDVGALANDGLVRLLLKLPAETADRTKVGFFGAWLKVEADVCGATLEGFSTIEVVETPTTSVDGTTRTLRNLSRLDTPPNSVVPVFLNTEATGGTVIHRGVAQGDKQYCSAPIIMKPLTNYLVRLQNKSGAVLTGGNICICVKQIPSFDYLYQKDQ